MVEKSIGLEVKELLPVAALPKATYFIQVLNFGLLPYLRNDRIRLDDLEVSCQIKMTKIPFDF